MHKVTYNRNADRYYTGGVCSAFFTTRAKADDFIQDLLYGWKRGGHSFDIDLDSIQITKHGE